MIIGGYLKWANVAGGISVTQMYHPSTIKYHQPFQFGRLHKKLDAGWPESEEEQVGNVKLEEEVTRRIRIDRQEERQTYLDR